jgi:hypothetical protein
MVIWKAQRSSHAGVVGLPAMNYINRREMGNDTNEKPFNARQMAKMMIKYSKVWTEVVSYIWRTHELDEISLADADGEKEGEMSVEEEEGRKGIREKRPGYRFTIGQT